MAGFYSKDLIVESFLYRSSPASTSFLLILRVCLTSAYRIRLSVLTLWSPFKTRSALLVNDESLYIYVSFFLLGSGAVCGGRFFSWLILPSLTVLSLPLLLKLLALSLIFLFGLFMYMLVWWSVSIPGFMFMGSMWFLTFITSPPLVGGSFSVGERFFVQELTWVEMLGGKGVFSNFHRLSSWAQLTQNLSFSHLFSFFAIVVFLFLLSF